MLGPRTCAVQARPCGAVAAASDRQQHPQRPPHQLLPATTGRRRLLGFAAPLLFLPWQGCDQGGNYSTGVPGSHGDNCQEIYQPAAAAEKRFAEKQRQAAATAAAAPAPPPPQPAAETPREERATMLKEQAAFEREAMSAEQEERTRQFVDGMWQSLE